MMRRRYILFFFAFAVTLAGCAGLQSSSREAPPADPSVVALIEGDPITLETFEEEYLQTVGSREAARRDSLAAYVDFLQRYVNYRLKVRAAQDLGYAQDPELVRELKNYRTEFGFPYMMEDRLVDPLVRTLYERSQYLVDASHILLRVTQDAAPEDTLEAFRRMQALRDSLVQGADFGTLAVQYSEDPSASMRGRRGYQGRLGYIAAGQVVEPFERAAFQTSEGELSPIFRSRFGYHVLKVHDRRAKPADIEVAHILIRPEGGSPAEWQEAKDLLDSLATVVSEGGDFAELAREYSEDPGTAPDGGKLGVVSYSSSLVPNFKEAAFALDEVGDVSEPLRTRYGFHLVKLLDRHPEPTLQESYDRLKARVKDLPRYKRATRELIDASLEENEASIDSAAIRRAFEDLPNDSLLFHVVEGSLPNQEATFASFRNRSYTFDDFGDYLAERYVEGEINTDKMLTLAHEFLVDRVLYYEAEQLEEDDPYFREVMDDFKEGLMLFALMQDSVWTAAREDSLALRDYYEAHRSDYQLPERTRVISIASTSDSLLGLVDERLDSETSVQSVLNELRVDSTTFRVDTLHIAEPTESVYDQALALEEGQHVSVRSQEEGHLVLVHAGVEAARPMTFEEARGQIVSVYQDILEERLIERLRETYDARVYPARLQQAFDQTADIQAADSSSK